MTKIRRNLLLVSVYLLIFSYFGSVVYAWILDKTPPALGEIHSGELKYQISSSRPTVEIGLPLDELLYVDISFDLANHQDSLFSYLVTRESYTITAQAQTIPWKMNLEVVILSDAVGLQYLIVFQGKNIDQAIPDIFELGEILDSFDLTELSSRDEWRSAIQSHNLETIQLMQEIMLEQGDTLRFQIVFFGDYYAIPNPNDILTIQQSISKQYLVHAVIEIAQIEKE
jgi:hypothetical protein